MRTIKRRILKALAVCAVGAAVVAPARALTNDLAAIQATTTNINSAADTGVTIGLGLLGLGFAIGGLGWGLKAAFKKRPT